jgi:aconitate hydratase
MPEKSNMLPTSSFLYQSKQYKAVDFPALVQQFPALAKLPLTLMILMENSLRHAAEDEAWHQIIKQFIARDNQSTLAFRPHRVLMQDFTGVPSVVDLASLRDACLDAGGDPSQIQPECSVDLVIDHSVQVQDYGNSDAFLNNVKAEFSQNQERYQFLKWAQSAFKNFRVVPPAQGICHQINLEQLACVWGFSQHQQPWVLPDTLVGLDSHTTMVNGLGVLGWGVGGIEAEAAMLGQPVIMRLPKVVGVHLTGKRPAGSTATDLVLMITERLRQHGVVGKLVEFCGPGVSNLSLEDRATIANMAPEYGATCGFFPLDEESLRYLLKTGRSQEHVDFISKISQSQGLWHDPSCPKDYDEQLDFCLADVEPCMAGPKRPQDRVALSSVAQVHQQYRAKQSLIKVSGNPDIPDGAVVIAAITSCTNTSNPAVMIAAGLLAQKAHSKGLSVAPWVKTSFAPGSKNAVNYLEQLGLLSALQSVGFYLVGLGCTTCIGNSGPLSPMVQDWLAKYPDAYLGAVLSGNRNFEGRIHRQVQENWLASPPLVIAYALAGQLNIDLTKQPLGQGSDGQPVFLKDIWPSDEQITACSQKITNVKMSHRDETHALWQAIDTTDSLHYQWQPKSTYIRQPNFCQTNTSLSDIENGRVLAVLGDSITTDHISPAGVITSDSEAGQYLVTQGVKPEQFNSFGARRGNHEVMMRGTFANLKIQNHLTDRRGGFTVLDNGQACSIYQAAMHYQKQGNCLVVLAGDEYGTGSSRDWAAKGPALLGVRVVVAKSFERIHRSNLVGMGIVPCVPSEPIDWPKDAKMVVSIKGLSKMRLPGEKLELIIETKGQTIVVPLIARLDTEHELRVVQAGGILPYVLKSKLNA